MSSASFWLVIVAVGAGTVAMRSVPIIAHGRMRAHPVVTRLLRHVPAAALAALVASSAAYIKDVDAYVLAPSRIVAALIALIVAYRTRNVVLTLVVGMGSLWVLGGLLGA